MRLYKIHRNFACFWPPNFFRGVPPEFLDLHYKIEPDSNRVVKFDGDRPRELGDLALKKKETSRAFYKSSRYTYYGRPNKLCGARILLVTTGSLSKTLMKIHPGLLITLANNQQTELKT